MRVIFVLFDSLNRHILEAYGGDLMETPNFNRLAQRTVTFDQHHVGSLPCMPARRDLQTGRHSFLHRSWGPMEPFDDSLPEILKVRGTYSHLITDHYHYFEDGGATYHTRYNSYEFIRGQERDPWKAMVQPPWERLREMYHPDQYSEQAGSYPFHYMVNREYIREEGEFPCVQCFKLGCDFLETNRAADDWFLQIETFDPHEPFFAPPRLRAKFQTSYDGPIRDWPPYSRVTQNKAECEELKANYMALVALCDEQIGLLLDRMDALGLWEDTALVVTTDHGYLLGEHEWWAKNRMHCYGEIAHIPLFIHHPDFASRAGERRAALTQTTDLMPTFLDMFGQESPADVSGKSLMKLLDRDDPKFREAVVFGYFGGAINITDGRYTYFRYPNNIMEQELYQYTLMPTHMTKFFTPEELKRAELTSDLPFTKGTPVLKVPVIPQSPWYQSHGPAVLADCETVLFDLWTDPAQEQPIHDAAIERGLARAMVRCLLEIEAPEETFRRFGLRLDS